MRRRTVRERGSPIYIRDAGGVVALVLEVAVRETEMPLRVGLRLRALIPSAVYVIDGGGVRRMAFGRGRARMLALLLLALAAAPLQYLLARRKGSRGER